LLYAEFDVVLLVNHRINWPGKILQPINEILDLCNQGYELPSIRYNPPGLECELRNNPRRFSADCVVGEGSRKILDRAKVTSENKELVGRPLW
jgi:hypothetical protein